jgi:hypothetical protein
MPYCPIATRLNVTTNHAAQGASRKLWLFAKTGLDEIGRGWIFHGYPGGRAARFRRPATASARRTIAGVPAVEGWRR